MISGGSTHDLLNHLSNHFVQELEGEQSCGTNCSSKYLHPGRRNAGSRSRYTFVHDSLDERLVDQKTISLRYAVVKLAHHLMIVVTCCSELFSRRRAHLSSTASTCTSISRARWHPDNANHNPSYVRWKFEALATILCNGSILQSTCARVFPHDQGTTKVRPFQILTCESGGTDGQ